MSQTLQDSSPSESSRKVGNKREESRESSTRSKEKAGGGGFSLGNSTDTEGSLIPRTSSRHEVADFFDLPKLIKSIEALRSSWPELLSDSLDTCGLALALIQGRLPRNVLDLENRHQELDEIFKEIVDDYYAEIVWTSQVFNDVRYNSLIARNELQILKEDLFHAKVPFHPDLQYLIDLKTSYTQLFQTYKLSKEIEKLMKLLDTIKFHLNHHNCIKASETWCSIKSILDSLDFPQIDPIVYLKKELERLSEIIEDQIVYRLNSIMYSWYPENWRPSTYDFKMPYNITPGSDRKWSYPKDMNDLLASSNIRLNLLDTMFQGFEWERSCSHEGSNVKLGEIEATKDFIMKLVFSLGSCDKIKSGSNRIKDSVLLNLSTMINRALTPELLMNRDFIDTCIKRLDTLLSDLDLCLQFQKFFLDSIYSIDGNKSDKTSGIEEDLTYSLQTVWFVMKDQLMTSISNLLGSTITYLNQDLESDQSKKLRSRFLQSHKLFCFQKPHFLMHRQGLHQKDSSIQSDSRNNQVTLSDAQFYQLIKDLICSLRKFTGRIECIDSSLKGSSADLLKFVDDCVACYYLPEFYIQIARKVQSKQRERLSIEGDQQPTHTVRIESSFLEEIEDEFNFVKDLCLSDRQFLNRYEDYLSFINEMLLDLHSKVVSHLREILSLDESRQRSTIPLICELHRTPQMSSLLSLLELFILTDTTNIDPISLEKEYDLEIELFRELKRDETRFLVKTEQLSGLCTIRSTLVRMLSNMREAIWCYDDRISYLSEQEKSTPVSLEFLTSILDNETQQTQIAPKMFQETANKILFILRLEIRLQCQHHIETSFENLKSEGFESIRDHKCSSQIVVLAERLSSHYIYLSSFLSSSDLEYIFRDLPFFIASLYKEKIFTACVDQGLNPERLRIIRNDLNILQQKLIWLSKEASLQLIQPRNYCDLLCLTIDQFISFSSRHPEQHSLETYENLLKIVFDNQKREANLHSSEPTKNDEEEFLSIKKNLHRAVAFGLNHK